MDQLSGINLLQDNLQFITKLYIYIIMLQIKRLDNQVWYNI